MKERNSISANGCVGIVKMIKGIIPKEINASAGWNAKEAQGVGLWDW